MTNKQNVYAQPEVRHDRRTRNRHPNKALELRSISCPADGSPYSEHSANPIRQYNSYQGNQASVEVADRMSERRNRSYSNNSSSGQPTNSSLNVYNEVQYGDIKPTTKRRQTSVTHDGRNGNYNDVSSTVSGHSNHSRKQRSRQSSNAEDLGFEKTSGRCGSTTKTNDLSYEGRDRPSRKRKERSSSGKPRHSTKDNHCPEADVERGRPKSDQRRQKRGTKATSYNIPNLDPFSTNEYIKSCSASQHRLDKVCSKSKLFMVLGFVFFSAIGVLMLVGYTLGYFGKYIIHLLLSSHLWYLVYANWYAFDCDGTYPRICSWNQSVLSNEGRVSC